MFGFLSPASKGSVLIHRDVQDVFDQFASAEVIGRLLGTAVDQTIGPGMAVEKTHKVGPIETKVRVEVTEYERPWKIHLRATGVPKRKRHRVTPAMDFSYEVCSAPGGARLTETHRQQLASILVLPLAILTVPINSWSIRRSLRKLKAEIESGRR